MDMNDLLTRIIKYVVEGVAVALALVFIPRKSLPLDEILTVTIAAAAVFAVLDIFSPSIGVTPHASLNSLPSINPTIQYSYSCFMRNINENFQ